jgi:hypothetical protein
VKPLRSPFLSGQVRRRWYHRLPFISPWNEYIRALKHQLAKRGAVPAGVWGDQARQDIAKKVEGILCEHCWREYLAFHPDDPWMIVGEWEVGDMSEVEVLMEIEAAFKVVMPAGKTLMELLGNGWTFGDLVSHIAAAAPPARDQR